MRANGWATCAMASENKNGQTVHSTRESGSTIKLKARASSRMPMEITMKESGKMIKLMATGSMFIIKRERSMKATGSRTCNMDLV